jgi:heme exporter protein C
MLGPLLTCAVGFSLLFMTLVLARVRAAVMERRVEALELARAREADRAPAEAVPA